MDQTQIVNVFFAVFSFLLGAVVGSFLNVCIYRVPRGESVVRPASRCPKCGNRILWYDNIPIVSWLLLGAKCRYCGETISWQYPLVESITGLLFLLVFWRFGFVLATPIYMALAAALVMVAFVDLAEWIIPDEVTLPGIPLAVACAVVATWYEGSGLRVSGLTNPVFDALIGIEAGGLLFLLDKAARLLLNKRGMGMGDVKLLAMLGGFFGWIGVILITLIAAVIGSVVGIITLALTRKGEAAPKTEAASSKRVPLGGWLGMPGTILITATFMFVGLLAGGKKEETAKDSEEEEEDHEITLAGHYLPFGPYLCLAGLIVMFFGADIIDYYFSIMDVGI